MALKLRSPENDVQGNRSCLVGKGELSRPGDESSSENFLRLNPEPVVDGASKLLFAPEVSFRGLDGDVPEQELNLQLCRGAGELAGSTEAGRVRAARDLTEEWELLTDGTFHVGRFIYSHVATEGYRGTGRRSER